MIVAIVGFIFACIGALIVGWVPLPIAFVLSIVSLFLKGERKWIGVVGLIVSIIGTIVGFVVFFAVIAGAIDEAVGSGDTTVSQPVEEGAESAADAKEPADAAVEGTRENSYPLKSGRQQRGLDHRRELVHRRRRTRSWRRTASTTRRPPVRTTRS